MSRLNPGYLTCLRASRSSCGVGIRWLLSFRGVLALGFAALAQISQVLKRVDAGLVPIAPPRVQGIVSHHANTHQLRVFNLHEVPLTSMSLTNRTRTPATQVDKRIIAELIVIPENAQQLFFFYGHHQDGVRHVAPLFQSPES